MSKDIKNDSIKNTKKATTSSKTKRTTKTSTKAKKITKKVTKKKEDISLTPVSTIAETIHEDDKKGNTFKRFATNIFSSHRKQFDDTKQKRILLLVSYCIFLCVLVGLMCALYLCLVYSTMPLRKNLGISKEEIATIKNSYGISDETAQALQREVNELELKISQEKDKQSAYDEKDTLLATLIKQRDDLKEKSDNANKQINDSNEKIKSLEKKIAELEELINKNK